MGYMGSSPGQGTGISHALQCSQEKKKRKKKKDMAHLNGFSLVLTVQISEKLTMVVVV